MTYDMGQSNDLDLATLSALEEYLTEVFDGCLVVVSHDRFFMDKVAEHIFVFEVYGCPRVLVIMAVVIRGPTYTICSLG